MVQRPTFLTKDHDVSQFDCGKAALSDWLKKYALQSDQSNHTKTLVVTEDGKTVIAYYSFSVVSVEHHETTSPRVKKGLGRYSIPVFLIARLAVDRRHQDKGLGTRLMRHALRRAALLAVSEIPIRAIVVDAIDQDAKQYYSRFDFEPWPVDSLRLWLLMKDLLKTLASISEVDHVLQDIPREDIVKFMAAISPRERDILRLRFGLDDGRQRTVEEVAQLFRITQERVHQIEVKALRKLSLRKLRKPEDGG